MNADAAPIAADQGKGVTQIAGDQGKGVTQIAADEAQMAADEPHENGTALAQRRFPGQTPDPTMLILSAAICASSAEICVTFFRTHPLSAAIPVSHLPCCYRRQSAWHRRSPAIQQAAAQARV